MKGPKECAWSLAALVACGAYVYLHFRFDLNDDNAFYWVVIAGILALCWFLFWATSERFHPLVIKLIVGCGALVATACAVAFVKYTWPERAELQEKLLLSGFILFCLLAVGVSAVAWMGFWNCLRGKIQEGDGEPDPDQFSRDTFMKAIFSLIAIALLASSTPAQNGWPTCWKSARWIKR